MDYTTRTFADYRTLCHDTTNIQVEDDYELIPKRRSNDHLSREDHFELNTKTMVLHAQSMSDRPTV